MRDRNQGSMVGERRRGGVVQRGKEEMEREESRLKDKKQMVGKLGIYMPAMQRSRMRFYRAHVGSYV